MKNLNKTLKRAAMPALSTVKSVSKKTLYSLCGVVCLVTCSLSTMAKDRFGHFKANPYTLTSLGLGAIEDFAKSHRALLTGNNSGTDFSNAFELFYHLGFTTSATTTSYFQQSSCTSCSPITHNYGDPTHSGNDMWIHIIVDNAGYLTLRGGTSDFDSFFYLLDSSQNVLATGDDGRGSGGTGAGGVLYQYMQPEIHYYVSAGDYYLVVDGTDKVGLAKSGTVLIDYELTH